MGPEEEALPNMGAQKSKEKPQNVSYTNHSTAEPVTMTINMLTHAAYIWNSAIY